ncbi:hypothetical protein [Nonomuraea typhae]|uniref:Uncharacterized protein n=1 Tax=Nonomuraea typhae TaxID=2603600 RepID=A0ABW7YJS8_9ACTN
MRKDEIQTDVWYAVDGAAKAPRCIRALDLKQRVTPTRRTAGTGPVFKTVEYDRHGAGYAVVVVADGDPEVRVLAQELTLDDFLTTHTLAVRPGVTFDIVRDFRKFAGPYDSVIAQRDFEAKEAARRKEARQAEASISERLFGSIEKQLERAGVTVNPAKTAATFGPQVVFGGSIELGDLAKVAELAEIGAAALKLYDAADMSDDGVPTFADAGEQAYTLWYKINKILPAF